MADNFYGIWNTDAEVRHPGAADLKACHEDETYYIPFETSFFRKPDSYLTEEEVNALIESGDLDATCVQITCLVASGLYLTEPQIRAHLALRGEVLTPEELKEKIDLLLRCNFLRRVECCLRSRVTLACYCTGVQGNAVAKSADVHLHRGNCYMSKQKRMQLNKGVVDEPQEIKRVVQANMVILGLLNAGIPMAHYGIRETLRTDDGGISDSIVRTIGTMQLDRANHLVLEVIRKDSDWEAVWSKIDRFSRMIKRPDFLETVTISLEGLPQLIVCGEDDTHNRQIHQMLERRGILAQNPDMTVLYTTDQQVRKDPLEFYAFEETGEKLFFSLGETNQEAA